MNTIIEKIRAEIERKRDQNQEGENSYYDVNDSKNAGICRHKRILCEELLAKLSDLEKSEKPTLAEGLEEELKDYFRHYYNCDYPMQIENKTCSVMMIHLVECARHFAQWGAEHAKEQSKPKVSDGLETEALRSAGVLLSEHFEDEDDDAIRTTALRCWKGGVIHGSSWQKEQMMKGAVEWDYTLEDGRIEFEGDPLPCLNPILNLPYPKFKPGQKVKLIIIKEDEK